MIFDELDSVVQRLAKCKDQFDDAILERNRIMGELHTAGVRVKIIADHTGLSLNTAHRIVREFKANWVAEQTDQ